jgi:hypothetical protein
MALRLNPPEFDGGLSYLIESMLLQKYCLAASFAPSGLLVNNCKLVYQFVTF